MTNDDRNDGNGNASPPNWMKRSYGTRALLVLAVLLGGFIAALAVPRLFDSAQSETEFVPDTAQFGEAQQLGGGAAVVPGAGSAGGDTQIGNAGQGRSVGGADTGPGAGEAGGGSPEGTAEGETNGGEGGEGGEGGGEGGEVPGSPDPGSPDPETPDPGGGIPDGPGGLAPGGQGPGGPGDIPFGGGAGAGGCADQCIIKALVTPGVGTPDLGLEVKTTTNARIKVDLSTQPNQINPNGDARTAGFVTEWSTLLQGLEWDTEYHIRVWAEDLNGSVAWRVGKVKTPEETAVQGPGYFNPVGGAGCSVQCINWAHLYPIDDSPNLELRVNTDHPAKLRMYVSQQAPQFNPKGEPFFPDAQPLASTGNASFTNWTTTLDLGYGTNYYGIVSATDSEARTQYRTGSFSTGKPLNLDLVITFHQIQVGYSGDNGGANPGELRFSFEVGGNYVQGSRMYEPASSGDTIVLDDDHNPGPERRVTMDLPQTFLPTLRVQGADDDTKSGGLGFCEPFFELIYGQEHGRDVQCNERDERTYNTATWGGHLVGEMNNLPLCSSLGVPETSPTSRCLVIETTYFADDYPRFAVLVSLDKVPPA